MDKVKILRDWIESEGRRQNWVAQQVGVSPQWLNYVLKGKKPLSDRLANALYEKLGVPLVNKRRSTRKVAKKRSGLKVSEKAQA